MDGWKKGSTNAFQKIKISSDQDTFFLLRQIWWKYNDYYREGNEAELAQEIKNKMPELLNKLLKKFDEEKNEHLLLKGELLRELGHFEAAEKTLKQVTVSEYLEAKELILDLVESEEADLKKLNI